MSCYYNQPDESKLNQNSFPIMKQIPTNKKIRDPEYDKEDSPRFYNSQTIIDFVIPHYIF